MILRLAIVSSLAATASAAPAPHPPPPPAPCTIQGKAIFEIEHVTDGMPATLGDRHARAAQSVVETLFDNGAWTTARTDAHGKLGKPDKPTCLFRNSLDEITKKLAAAPWKIAHAQITCKAYSAQHTIYRVRGKQMWDQRICGADSVDAKTEQLLTEIAKLWKPPPPRDPCEAILP